MKSIPLVIPYESEESSRTQSTKSDITSTNTTTTKNGTNGTTSRSTTTNTTSSIPAIAIIGAGLIGRTHLSYFKTVGIECCGIVDPSPMAEDFAKEQGVPYYTDIEILIEDYKKGEIRVDGMILATPNSMHLSGAITCAKHRIPALIEKPVTATIKEGEELLRVLEKYDNVHMLVGHHRRHSGALATAVNIIQSGQLGKIVSINGNAQFYKPAHYYKTGPWRTLKSTGGGPVLINLIHEMDNLRALCGEVTSVQAMSSNETRSHEVEDTVVINLRFASGALGSFTLSDTATGPMSWEQTSGENKNYGRDFNADCYFIAGTRASLAVPTMKVWKNSGEESDWMKDLERECVFVPDIDPLSKQLSHFVEVIRGNATPIVPVKSAFESLKVVQCVLEAMETGNTVYLSTISSSNKINHADESQI